MSAGDKEIAEILGKYGEPFATNVWRVQGNAVIYHKALERIAAVARIAYDPPTILRAEREEAVILVTGHMGDRTEWSIGEALINVNYRVTGKQAAYVYAMAEKRAKDRVILKLIGLHGLVYSEDEADDFKDGRPGDEHSEGAQLVSSEERIAADLRRRLGSCRAVDDVTGLMTDPDTQRSLADLPMELRDQIRDHAKSRMVALGWTPKKDRA